MKLAKAVTDTGPQMGRREKTQGVANLFLLLSEFGTEEDVAHFERAYEDGVIRYVELKAVLAERIVDHFALFRKKKRDLLADKEHLRRIYTKGAQHAREIAQETMSEVWGRIGLVR
jgi:tryptophanyl-tRNA synthetase